MTVPLDELEPLDPLKSAYRRWGFLQAGLDGLGRLGQLTHPDIVDAERGATPEGIEALRRAYCGTVGVEFMHMIDRDRIAWIAGRMERAAPQPDSTIILDRLMQTELFERFLHTRYVGSKRYSLEGVAGVIPLVEAVLDGHASRGGESAVIATSHRGRINMMATIVGVPAEELFAGLEDVDPRSVLGSGDVKYHLGATGVHDTVGGRQVRVHLVSNPSHLEAVNPVVMGRARAKQDRMGKSGAGKILPLTLHGDAAFAGQGITAETLNFAALPHYTVGGTIHIIMNNLIGFTTDYPLLHSSRFSSDLAKRLSIPIFHVNGEDADAVFRVGQLAAEYRAAFREDVVIDLIGYRRYGHSEVEDPSTTQPLLYRKIEDRRMLYEIYAEEHRHEADVVEQRREEIWSYLEGEQDKGRARTDRPAMRTLPEYWDSYVGGPYDPSYEVDTGIDLDRLREICERITSVPDGFSLHPKVKRVFDQRRKMAKGKFPVDWGTAEALAFGSLLWDGCPVRISGEDTRRGTFNQRHAIVVDVETGEGYVPLSHLHRNQATFTAADSPLSEAAALGYEYGYSRDYPDALVCWEAQFGDFANGAQTIIDQFITAGEDKWKLLSGVVMLLPHGYEGQGPEHSSARLERFLQLAAEDNMQICQPATSCQYFHLLRRQALRRWRKPLVVFTPKSLLRAKVASCATETFARRGRFRMIAGDGVIEDADRLLICSGKIYHELVAERERRKDGRTAIISLTQLYPFPSREFEQEVAKHPRARKVIWVQEEPANMGALFYVRPIIQRILGERHVTSIKRSESASPATGSAKAHALEQSALIKLAFA